MKQDNEHPLSRYDERFRDPEFAAAVSKVFDAIGWQRTWLNFKRLDRRYSKSGILSDWLGTGENIRVGLICGVCHIRDRAGRLVTTDGKLAEVHVTTKRNDAGEWVLPDGYEFVREW